MAVYKAVLDVGDTVLSMDLNSGGHLTHGSPVSFSGKEYNIISYGLKDDETIDYEGMEELAKKYKVTKKEFLKEYGGLDYVKYDLEADNIFDKQLNLHYHLF